MQNNPQSHDSSRPETNGQPDPNPAAESSYLQGALPAAAGKQLRRVEPLPEALREQIRQQLLDQFVEHAPMMLEMTAEHFTSIMPHSDEFFGDPDGEALQERHRTVKRLLIDMLETAEPLIELASKVASESNASSCAECYENKVVPWLNEYNGLVETITQLEADIFEFVEDSFDDYMDDEDEDEFDDELDELDDEDSEFNYDPSTEFALEEGIDLGEEKKVLSAEERFQELLDLSIQSRFLLSQSRSLSIDESTDRVSSDVNLALLELTRTRGVPCQYSADNPIVGINQSELEFCITHTADVLKRHFADTFSDVLNKSLVAGALYSGENSVKLRESVNEHWRTQYPLLAGTSGQGVVVITHAIPEILSERWKDELTPLTQELSLVKDILESRDHSLAVVYDEELRAFSIKIQLRHGIERPEEDGAAYCEQQQATMLGDAHVMAKLDDTTLVRLPRRRGGSASDSDPYELELEAVAASQLIGNSRALDSLIRQADKIAGDLPEISRIALHADVAENTAEEVLEAYQESGDVNVRLFSERGGIKGFLAGREQVNFEELIRNVARVSSDPYGDTYMMHRPFHVSSPPYGKPPVEQVIILDDVLSASSAIRSSLSELCSIKNIRIGLSREFFSEYSGVKPRVEFAEEILEHCAKAVKSIGRENVGGVSIDWFSGCEINGIDSFGSGFLARLYNPEGEVIAQGIADGSSRDRRFLKPVNQELLKQADDSLKRLEALPLSGGSGLSKFGEDLASCGLEVDEFFLHSAVWHLRQDSLRSDGIGTTPREVVSQIFRLPQITPVEKDGRVCLRRAEPQDLLDL